MEKGRWIWKSSTYSRDEYVEFRDFFELDENNATLYIAAETTILLT